MSNKKIAIIQTHPIQHFCPQFASYSKLESCSIKVFFETDKGTKPYFDKQFGKEIKWEGIDLDTFPHEFLNGNSIGNRLDIFKPDILVVYGYTKDIQVRATKWGRDIKIPLFYISDSENHQKRPFLKNSIKKQVLKRKFKNYDVFLSVGDANEDFYKWCGVENDNMVRMFFPIDVNHLNTLIETRKTIRNNVRVSRHIPKDVLILSNVGKLVSWKSQSDLIEAVYRLEQRDIPCVGILIGSGPDLDKLKKQTEKLTKNKIIFTGFVQPEEMMNYLVATDIYIHTAAKEPHSLAISEAIYLGCPVILSDTCGSYGTTDDVQPGKNGFVYPYGNIDKLVDYISLLYKKPELLKSFRENSTIIGRRNQHLAHGEALKSAINLVL